MRHFAREILNFLQNLLDYCLSVGAGHCGVVSVGPRLSGAKPGSEQCLPLRGKQPHERVCEANWRRSLCAAKRPRTPAGVNGSSVGAAYMPPAAYRGNPSTGKGEGCRPPLPLSLFLCCSVGRPALWPPHLSLGTTWHFSCRGRRPRRPASHLAQYPHTPPADHQTYLLFDQRGHPHETHIPRR